MPLSAIPNLAQLRHFRRTGRFDPSIRADRFDVMKSADSPVQVDFIGPNIACLQREGKLLGFGTVEIPTPAELAKLKQPVAKSAEAPAADGNEVFDGSPLLPDFSPNFVPIVQSIGVLEVSKSAEISEPDVLEGLFPPCLRTT